MISTHENRMTSAQYARMGHAECERIHMATLEILERTGVDVHDEKARKILVDGGASADGLRMRIPESMVTRALASAPRRLTLYDRYQMEVMLNHTAKPIVFVSPDVEGCVAAVEMCEAVAGGAAAFRRHPFATCYINVTSGLVANAQALQTRRQAPLRPPTCLQRTI
jgi:trimethylamine:corrinoid methyltransferase-like protein